MNANDYYNTQSVAYKVKSSQAGNSFVSAYPISLPAKLGFYSYVKRFLDFLLALISLPFFIPILLVISLLIKINSPGTALFKQTRIGQNGKLFKIYKFRTMTNNAPPEMATKEFEDASQYITRIGKFLRRTSFDELPQIFNILRGDMSFIGPRPLILSEKEIHSLRLAKGIYTLKPGITGLAQINGRDLVGPKEKVQLDEEYLHSFSFVTDTKIYVKTIYVVLCRKGFCDENGKQNP